jgi:hypothetical protein
MESVNKAVNEAGFIRSIVGVMWIFYILAIVAYRYWGPLNIASLGGLGVTAALLVFSAVLLILWQLRYGSLATSDKDHKRAKQTWIVSLMLWLLMALMGITPAILYVLFPVSH